MSKILACNIPAASTSYDIEIKSGILNDRNALMPHLKTYGSRFAVITDDIVSHLYAERLCQHISAYGPEAFLFSFPHGEPNKCRAAKENLENRLFEKGLGRDTCVIAMGGGVATDLGGYIAATYCRGVPLIMIPTSLLAMVDASIGGKTGINVPYGKNMLGCVYQPKKVIIDPTTLNTLPVKELKNGLVEMIKHGVIADAAYLEFLETHADQILALNPKFLESAIYQSCRIKKEIVEEDEKETGKRRLLNFGHTLGHALENLTQYSMSHGEAVAIGMLVESRIAVQSGILSQAAFERIHGILLQYKLPLQLPGNFSTKTILNAMILDKKSFKGKPRCVMINDIGSAMEYNGNFCTHADEKMLDQALKWMSDALCCH